MTQRDIIYKTNIHKYGYNKLLPEEINIASLNYKDKISSLNFVNKLAKEYDTRLMNEFEEYESRYEFINCYIMKSIKEVKNS